MEENLSFTESQFKGEDSATRVFQTSRLNTETATDYNIELRKSTFIDYQASLQVKLDPREVFISDPSEFPIRVYRTNYLALALSKFTFSDRIENRVKRLIKLPEMKKCFLYVFWLYFGMKFKDRSFTTLDKTQSTGKTKTFDEL